MFQIRLSLRPQGGHAVAENYLEKFIAGKVGVEKNFLERCRTDLIDGAVNGKKMPDHQKIDLLRVNINPAAAGQVRSFLIRRQCQTFADPASYFRAFGVMPVKADAVRTMPFRRAQHGRLADVVKKHGRGGKRGPAVRKLFGESFAPEHRESQTRVL